MLALAGWLAATTARSEPIPQAVFIARAEAAYAIAMKAYQADTNSPAAAGTAGKASAALADLATNDTQRAQVARSGIAVCQQLLALASNSVPGHYYLAINLGQLAKAEAPSFSAYRRVHEVEREFLAAAKLDAQFDHAGPARSLGLLYFEAPGWPWSVGSKSRAREWLERAAQLAPDYPANPLSLAEAQLKWRERAEAEKSLKKIDEIWPAAQTNYVGEAWQEEWQDWDARRAALQADYQRLYGQTP